MVVPGVIMLQPLLPLDSEELHSEGDPWHMLHCPAASTGAGTRAPAHVQRRCSTPDTRLLLRDAEYCGRKKSVAQVYITPMESLFLDLSLVTSLLRAFVFSSVVPISQSWNAVKMRWMHATAIVVEGKTIITANVVEDFLCPRCFSKPFPYVTSFNFTVVQWLGLSLSSLYTWGSWGTWRFNAFSKWS